MRQSGLPKKYFFISYNSEDADRISPFAMKLNDSGIPVWYDEGLVYGEKWEEMVGEKLSGALGVIFFFTKQMLEKDDSYALKEYRIAKRQGLKIYFILVDPLEDVFWNKYPKKSYFLDDIEQTQFSNNVDSLIQHIFNTYHFEGGSVPNSHNVTTSSKNKMNFTSPTVVDSEYLLTNGFFTAAEISQRHVDLDLLTIDGNLFPEALEAEGDASTWEEMITETADSSANLIINNQIVAYMDFVPVTPEDYDKLKTSPFNDSYVAFYSFGGRFDIFVSMFSFEPNYLIPSNIILFIKWMVDRIIEWKEQDINIGRIEFSIYSKQQAKALENLGLKLALTNKLKGMLYEIKVEDLLNNKILLTKFGASNFKKYNYVQITKDDVEDMDECRQIMNSNLVRSGGILQYEGALDDSDIVLCAKYGSKPIGYICLRKYDVLENAYYIEQIAVTENHRQLGIGKHLVDEAIKITRDASLSKIYANCKKINLKSQSLLKNCGFEQFDMSKEQYLEIGISESDIEKNLAFVLKIDK